MVWLDLKFGQRLATVRRKATNPEQERRLRAMTALANCDIRTDVQRLRTVDGVGADLNETLDLCKAVS